MVGDRLKKPRLHSQGSDTHRGDTTTPHGDTFVNGQKHSRESDRARHHVTVTHSVAPRRIQARSLGGDTLLERRTALRGDKILDQNQKFHESDDLRNINTVPNSGPAEQGTLRSHESDPPPKRSTTVSRVNLSEQLAHPPEGDEEHQHSTVASNDTLTKSEERFLGSAPTRNRSTDNSDELIDYYLHSRGSNEVRSSTTLLHREAGMDPQHQNSCASDSNAESGTAKRSVSEAQPLRAGKRGTAREPYQGPHPNLGDGAIIPERSKVSDELEHTPVWSASLSRGYEEATQHLTGTGDLNKIITGTARAPPTLGPLAPAVRDPTHSFESDAVTSKRLEALLSTLRDAEIDADVPANHSRA